MPIVLEVEHVQIWYHWGHLQRGDGGCTGHSSGRGFPTATSYHASQTEPDWSFKDCLG